MRYVFFFKQKTADEMRISDWSSDVCSSDLIPRWAFCPTSARQAAAEAVEERDHGHLTNAVAVTRQADLDGVDLVTERHAQPHGARRELGRASGRQSVRQYA